MLCESKKGRENKTGQWRSQNAEKKRLLEQAVILRCIITIRCLMSNVTEGTLTIIASLFKMGNSLKGKILPERANSFL